MRYGTKYIYIYTCTLYMYLCTIILTNVYTFLSLFTDTEVYTHVTFLLSFGILASRVLGKLDTPIALSYVPVPLRLGAGRILFDLV